MKVRGIGGRTSLRLRLTAGLVALTALVLAGSSVVVLRALSGFLTGRIDQQVQQLAVQQVALLNGPPGRFIRPNGIESRVPQPPGALALVIGSNGTILYQAEAPDGGRPPVAVSAAQVQRLQRLATPAGRASTLQLGTTSYRVRAFAGDGSMLVAGLPMRPVNDTLHQLTLVELGVGLGALLAVGTAGAFLVRHELRPLSRISAAARDIASTDLSSAGTAVELRVPDAPEGTEVGQLSRGLNVMLSNIDAAFEARTLAEQRLRQFVADASHELRTPLSSIRGYAELFRRGAGIRPEDLATAMRRIEEEGQQMSVLVDDLLLLARLDQGRPLDQQPVDLAALAVDAATDSRVVDPRWPVRLELPPEPVVVTGDEMRLRQVLGNLVRNVRMHTPPGTTVTLGASANTTSALLRVHDNGPGIPPDALSHVFDRFYRADPSRSRAAGGSGLGLSIVQAIGTAHGGTVTMSSSPGSTTVQVTLPLSSDVLQRQPQPS